MKVRTAISSLASQGTGRTVARVRSGLLWATTQLFTLLTMVKGDALLMYGRPASIARETWTLIDAPIHGLLAMLVTWPLAIRGQSSNKFLARLSLAGLVATLIDLDHFVAAGSFSLYSATHLGYRPITHSLMFALVSALSVWRITRDPRDGCLWFIALASHFLRDASTGGIHYLLWPFGFDRLSVPAYYASQIGLSAAAWLIAWRFKPHPFEAAEQPNGSPRPLPDASTARHQKKNSQKRGSNRG